MSMAIWTIILIVSKHFAKREREGERERHHNNEKKYCFGEERGQEDLYPLPYGTKIYKKGQHMGAGQSLMGKKEVKF